MQPSLPTGAVTFLFTDVEGSTRLLQDLGAEAYAGALAEHRRLVREACAARDGVEVDTQGDAFFYAFSDAAAAVAAATDAKAALAGGRIRLRMGLHTGRPRVTDEGYVGEDVHLGARIAAAGHGGQVLLSTATAADVDDLDLTDLGEHRLKDFLQPVALFQLGSERFPPLKTISNTNLPRPASSFVGRKRETAEVTALLRDEARLLTLSGPAGSGKTRLAVEAAAELVGEFRAGVFWVGLAALRDSALVPEAIGQTLGAKNGLADHIGEREMLLLLDNLEQVVEAAPDLAFLVERCPNLRLLVTSRERLRVRGEVEYSVPPLAEPEAVSLFCDRTRLERDETIAELCRRLDNLPLAVELAAARTSVLTPQQIVDRLAQRLDLLKGGRDAEARQRTLRATIGWSHDLLDEHEQRLFARLAVFEGGCTLDAAETVCSADLDVLQSLVDKSLVRYTDDRFWMLEMIREYALEQLPEHAGAELRERHARYFLALSEQKAPELEGERQGELLGLLEQEAANLRAALACFGVGAQHEGLRLAFALRFFWIKGGYLGEGRRLVENLLAADQQPTTARARALATAALLATLQGDWNSTIRWAEEGRQLGLELGEYDAAGSCSLTLGRATLARGDEGGALALFDEAAALAETTGNQNLVAMAAFNLGYAALEHGEIERALAEFEAATTAADPYLVARARAAAGSAALRAGNSARAAGQLRDSLRILSTLSRYEDTAAWGLELYATAIVDSDPSRATRLLGAAELMREELGLLQQGIELDLHEQTIATARCALGDDAFAASWSAGRTLEREHAIAEALKD